MEEAKALLSEGLLDRHLVTIFDQLDLGAMTVAREVAQNLEVGSEGLPAALAIVERSDGSSSGATIRIARHASRLSSVECTRVEKRFAETFSRSSRRQRRFASKIRPLSRNGRSFRMSGFVAAGLTSKQTNMQVGGPAIDRRVPFPQLPPRVARAILAACSSEKSTLAKSSKPQASRVWPMSSVSPRSAGLGADEEDSQARLFGTSLRIDCRDFLCRPTVPL